MGDRGCAGPSAIMELGRDNNNESNLKLGIAKGNGGDLEVRNVDLRFG